MTPFMTTVPCVTTYSLYRAIYSVYSVYFECIHSIKTRSHE